MIKREISGRIGEERAGQICKAVPRRPEKKRIYKEPLKWAASAAIILLCGTTAAAAMNPELKNYLLERFSEKDVDTYIQDVKPSVGENEGEKDYDTADESELSLETPLWEVCNAWYDGVTLYFSASPREDVEKMSDRYEMNPSDHCSVNGQDMLIECSDAESGVGEISKGEQTGQYHFRVDLGGMDIRDELDVSFSLIVRKCNSREVFTRQYIQFHVDGTPIGRKVLADGSGEIALQGAKAEILKLALAPSALYVEVKYTVYGEDAEERAKRLYGERDSNSGYDPGYYIKDSFGNQMDGGWTNVGDQRKIEQEADGSYSVFFAWKTEGVNADTESLTFLPYSLNVGEDGKWIPDSEQFIDWAAFTVSLKRDENK